MSKHNAQRTDSTVGTWAVPSPEAEEVFPVHGQGTHFSHPHHSRAAAADSSCSLLRPAGSLSSASFPEASTCSWVAFDDQVTSGHQSRRGVEWPVICPSLPVSSICLTSISPSASETLHGVGERVAYRARVIVQ